ncbi:TetR/AcrR family transcriptional regulator [Micromonospora sp. AMSO1212t]|uniref:TetR/AcrR family transcriptional regulator n=1 Tax=Micromonospora sp. AMSO1212t TaxID=2650565 RepID=UPI00124B4CE7|nr:TetR/AcrR family transcriptional regulator [Micromonospora sp. AMSO1212t]KAB1910416.1 TetR/AcrR family transcriptional regulator [Micromonospora sp. AMSO1212t]
MVAEAKVTRATFYRHFPGKDDLIRAYLRRVHEMDRAAVEAATPDNPSPIDRLLAVTLPCPSLAARTSATAAESRTSAVRRPRARGRGRCRAGGRRPRGEAPRTGGGTHG